MRWGVLVPVASCPSSAVSVSEFNPSLGLRASLEVRQQAFWFWEGGTCRLPSPSAIRCHLWAQRTRAVANPRMWVNAGGAGRQRPTWRDAGGGSLASGFVLALEERDIPVSLGYWCSWEPLGRCPKRRGRERVGFETLHKQDGRSGRCRAPGAQRCVCAWRWGRGSAGNGGAQHTGPPPPTGWGWQRRSSRSGPILGCGGDGPQPALGAEHAAPARMSVMVMAAPSDAANPAAGG